MQEVIAFLSNLKENNNRAWFEENRPRYEAARDEFADLIQELIFRANSLMPLGNLSARECIFRIYNDMRFHQDRPPYKTNMGASIQPGGRRSNRAGYYLHVEPGNSFAAGGLYSPRGAQLRAIRKQIDEDAPALRAIVAEEAFVDAFGRLEGEKLKTSPRGYAADHPDIDLLNYKQFVVYHPLSRERLLAPGLADDVMGVFAAMTPLLRWLNEALDEHA